MLSMARQEERGGERQGGPSPGREPASASAPALIQAWRRACRLTGPRRWSAILISIGRASGEGSGVEERRRGPRQATLLLDGSWSAEPAPALVQARRRACRFARPRRRPTTPTGAGQASGEGPGMGERRGEDQGGPSRGRELVRLPHWFRSGGVPTASRGLGGDWRSPSASGEHSVMVRLAGDDRSCHRHSNGVVGERKRKREKEREGEEGCNGDRL